MKGHPNIYSAEELAWVEAHRNELRPVAHAAFVAQFGRSDVTFGAYSSLCKRNGWTTGRTGRFVKGQEAVNKGLPCPPGKGGRHPNARKHHFKKGGLPHNTKYLGHERISVDGYVEISVDQVNPHTGFERRYVLKHRHLWEQKNGPLPEGMVLKCLDGNPLNTDPENWDAIPRAALPYLNGHRGFDYSKADPEVRPAILTLSKLRHKLKAARKDAGKAVAS